MCEKRLVTFAAEASEQNLGPFDEPSGRLKGFPSDLNHLRHYRFGKASRHRIYLSGSHKNCFYLCWYVKSFKKNDKDEDNTKAFQAKLKNALDNPQNYVLLLDPETETYTHREIDEGNPQSANATPNPQSPLK